MFDKKRIDEMIRLLGCMKEYGVVIYGAGQRGHRAYDTLCNCGFQINGVIDKNLEIEMYGKKVDSIEDYERSDSVCIVTPQLDDVSSGELRRELSKHFIYITDMWIVDQLDSLSNENKYMYNKTYESPFPNLYEYEISLKMFQDEKLDGVDLDEKNQLSMIPFIGTCTREMHSFMNMKKHIDGKTCRWKDNNGMFSDGDAMVYHSMIRYYKPKRIIEIGSGWSTAIALDTIEMWHEDIREITCIEPYPERLLSVVREEDRKIIDIKKNYVQDIPLDVFRQLSKNDILFIDSTHVIRAGGDVLYEFFEILPTLNPGVVIHFHDIFYPFRYPMEWIKQGRPYGEAYLLRAFLSKNTNYRIVFWEDYICQKYKAEYEKHRGDIPNTGSSFWMMKNG